MGKIPNSNSNGRKVITLMKSQSNKRLPSKNLANDHHIDKIQGTEHYNIIDQNPFENYDRKYNKSGKVMKTQKRPKSGFRRKNYSSRNGGNGAYNTMQGFNNIGVKNSMDEYPMAPEVHNEFKNVEYRDYGGNVVEDVYVDYDDIMMVNGHQYKTKKNGGRIRSKSKDAVNNGLGKGQKGQRTSIYSAKNNKLSNLLAYQNEPAEEKKAQKKAKLIAKIERKQQRMPLDKEERRKNKSRKRKTLNEMRKRFSVISGGPRPKMEINTRKQKRLNTTTGTRRRGKSYNPASKHKSKKIREWDDMAMYSDLNINTDFGDEHIDIGAYRGNYGEG